MCNNMSDVRLSNASPTLERVDARQADNFRPTVRRNLFGTPDSEEIRRYVTATLQEDAQGFRERYNFDPAEERPLSPAENYEWEVDGDAPEFYRRAPHWRREAPPPRAEDRNGSRKRSSEDSGPCSSDCPSKIRHTDDEDDDDDDESDGAGGQSVRAAERIPTEPEHGAEVH